MPVFARTKLVMHDTCFEEKPGDVTLKFIGPNPMKLYQYMYEMIKTVFRAADADIQEENYSWGKTDVEKFKVRWWLHRDLDRFTYFWIRFDLSGQGTEKSGSAKVGIRPFLRTEYPQDTVWQRSLAYEMLRMFWHRIFYHNRRRDYIHECRDLVAFYARKMNEYFVELREKYG